MEPEVDEECSVQPMEMSFSWKIVLITLYGSVGIASLLGNLCVIVVVVFRKEMQTVTNIFISSLCATDLVITLVSLWTTPLAKYLQVWFLGESMCYMVASIQGASLIWVPFTLAVIAIDRYLMVASPFRQQMSIRRCLLIILAIWLTTFGVLTPSIANLEYFEFSCHKYCLENWRPHNEYRLLYGISVLIVRSGIPLIVIAWCNWRIASILARHGSKFQRNTTSVQTATETHRKQKLHKTLKAMVIIFALSSFPLDLFNVLQDLSLVMNKEIVPLMIVDFLYFSSHWIAMTGNLLNPLVYAWWNENFRRQIQIILAEFRGNNDEGKRGAYAVILSRGSSKEQQVSTKVVSEKTETMKDNNDVQV